MVGITMDALVEPLAAHLRVFPVAFQAPRRATMIGSIRRARGKKEIRVSW